MLDRNYPNYQGIFGKIKKYIFENHEHKGKNKKPFINSLDFENFINFQNLETIDIIDFINSKTEAVKEGEESCIAVYRTLRGLKNVLESAIKEIESNVVDTVQAYPKEYIDFRVSTRTTYQYNTSPLYIEKSKELKDIETLLKQATENKMKGIGHVTDAEGMIIDPVEVKYTQVLTYSSKGV